MEIREWYRHRVTGDRAYRETANGEDIVVFDRPGQRITRPFRKADWLPDAEHRPLSRLSIAQIAHAADYALCSVMGHRGSAKEWINLSGVQRVRWMEDGPQQSSVRRRLFNYVQTAVSWLHTSSEPPPDADGLADAVSDLVVARDQLKDGEELTVNVEGIVKKLWGEDCLES